jgi:hypothetical protein
MVRVLVCSVLMCLSFACRSWAQVGVIGGLAGPDLSPPVVSVQRANPFDVGRGREYTALPLYGWLLYPSLFFGGVYDSNVNQSSTAPVSAAGLRVVPSLLAELNDGIQKTTLYGMVDGRIYPDSISGDTNAMAARGGFIHTYEALRDLVFRFQGDYTRQTDLFSTLGIDHSVTSLNPTGIGLAPVANPQTYNQFSGLASVQKTFDRAFVSLAGSVVDITYDHLNVNQTSPDGVVYTGTGKGGFWFSPFLYAYTEASFDDRKYAAGTFDSHGYRVLGGVGSDQIGLFRGALYGGYQAEQFDLAALGTVGGPVFGGNLSYYLTRYLTIRGSVDETLGVSLLASAPGSPFGTATRVTSALLEAGYAIDPAWTASARAGYISTAYVDNPRIDTAWTAGGTLTYSVWRNFGLTLDYQYTRLFSNIPLQGFTRNVVTLGGTYRY